MKLFVLVATLVVLAIILFFVIKVNLEIKKDKLPRGIFAVEINNAKSMNNLKVLQMYLDIYGFDDFNKYISFIDKWKQDKLNLYTKKKRRQKRFAKRYVRQEKQAASILGYVVLPVFFGSRVADGTQQRELIKFNFSLPLSRLREIVSKEEI